MLQVPSNRELIVVCGRRRSRFKARTTQSGLACLCVSLSPSLSTPLAASVCVGGLAAAVKTFVRRVPLLARCLSPAGHEKAAKKGTAKHRNSLSIGQLERQSCAQAQSQPQSESEWKSRAQTAGAALALSLRESHAKLMRVFSSCLPYLNVYSVTLTLTHTRAVCDLFVN